MVNGAARRSAAPTAAERRGPAYNTAAAIRAAEAERERLDAAAAVAAIPDQPSTDAGAAKGERMADELLAGVDNHRILEAEADAIAAQFAQPAAVDAGTGAPAPTDQAQALAAETVQQAYDILSAAVVSQSAAVFIPNWRITPAETKDMSDAIVQALLLWFPDGMIPPKYMAVLAIAGVAARIAAVRKDPDTGELPPRYAPPPKRPAPAAAASSAQPAAPAAPQGVSHIFPHH